MLLGSRQLQIQDSSSSGSSGSSMAWGMQDCKTQIWGTVGGCYIFCRFCRSGVLFIKQLFESLL